MFHDYDFVIARTCAVHVDKTMIYTKQLGVVRVHLHTMMIMTSTYNVNDAFNEILLNKQNIIEISLSLKLE